MTMRQNGLAKLVEELGELAQVAGKMIQYPELQLDDSQNHPDGTNLRARLVEEMGDVLGAIDFVVEKLRLGPGGLEVEARAKRKLNLFRQWDAEHPTDRDSEFQEQLKANLEQLKANLRQVLGGKV